MKAGSRRKKVKYHKSVCSDIIVRGTAKQIAVKYEELAKEAENDKRFMTAENYSQFAEHYRKVTQDEK